MSNELKIAFKSGFQKEAQVELPDDPSKVDANVQVPSESGQAVGMGIGAGAGGLGGLALGRRVGAGIPSAALGTILGGLSGYGAGGSLMPETKQIPHRKHVPIITKYAPNWQEASENVPHESSKAFNAAVEEFGPDAATRAFAEFMKNDYSTDEYYGAPGFYEGIKQYAGNNKQYAENNKQ